METHTTKIFLGRACFSISKAVNFTDTVSMSSKIIYNTRILSSSTVSIPPGGRKLNSKPSLATIAKRAGVSKTAVCSALNGTEGVSEKTRRRVQQVADELGYRPNLLARALRTQRTGMIALVSYAPYAFVGMPFTGALDLRLREAGLHLVTACTYADPQRERESLEFFTSMGVDGLIVEPQPAPENLEFYGQLAQQKPLVLIQDVAPLVSIPASVVCVENQEVGYCAARHLLDSGRRHVAFLSVPDPDSQFWWASGRREGCRRALQEAGAPPLISIPIQHTWGEDDRDSSERSVCEFLSQGGSVDGIVAVNDGMAFGALRALAALGLRVPEEVAVVGVDDLPQCQVCTPPLTSVHIPLARMANEAADLLKSMLESGLRTPVHRVFSPQLVARASTLGGQFASRAKPR